MNKNGEPKTGLKLSTPAAILLGCVIGVILMIFLPNPMDSSVGGTDDNLYSAAASEAVSASRYALLGRQAHDEGDAALAALYYAASQANSEHARLLLEALPRPETAASALGQLADADLPRALDDYAKYQEIAEHESNVNAIRAFNYAKQADATQEALFRAAADGGAAAEYRVCPTCGAIFADDVPQVCPVCGTSGALFNAVKA